MSFKYYADCSRCPAGVECDLATGCEACHGSYPLECKRGWAVQCIIIQF